MGVRKIGTGAFQSVGALSDVEFSDRLEKLLGDCRSLKSDKVTYVRTVHLFQFCLFAPS